MRAFVVSEVDDILSTGVREVEPVASDQNDLLVAVDFSGVNFKDAMVAAPKSRVRRVAILVGGVDAAGTVRALKRLDVARGYPRRRARWHPRRRARRGLRAVHLLARATT